MAVLEDCFVCARVTPLVGWLDRGPKPLTASDLLSVSIAALFAASLQSLGPTQLPPHALLSRPIAAPDIDHSFWPSVRLACQSGSGVVKAGVEFLQHVSTRAWKDVRVEFRSREIVYTMSFFAAMVVLLVAAGLLAKYHATSKIISADPAVSAVLLVKPRAPTSHHPSPATSRKRSMTNSSACWHLSLQRATYARYTQRPSRF